MIFLLEFRMAQNRQKKRKHLVLTILVDIHPEFPTKTPSVHGTFKPPCRLLLDFCHRVSSHIGLGFGSAKKIHGKLRVQKVWFLVEQKSGPVFSECPYSSRTLCWVFSGRLNLIHLTVLHPSSIHGQSLAIGSSKRGTDRELDLESRKLKASRTTMLF